MNTQIKIKMGKKKIKLQALLFSKKGFNRSKIKSWISMNGFIIDKRLRRPIMIFNNNFKVRQRNPDWFIKKTFRTKSLGKGIKGIYGLIKKSK